MQENPHTCLNRNWKESDASHLKFPQAKRVSPVILIRGCDEDRPRNFLTEIRVEPSGGTKPGMHAEAAQSCPVGSTSLSCPCPSQTPRLLSPRSRGQARGHVVAFAGPTRCVCVCVACPVRCPRRARQRHGRRGGTFARVLREERARRRVENAPRMRRAQAARSASLPVPPSLSRSPESAGARRLGFCGSFHLDEFP